MGELEDKIREALPHLKELTKGCIIYGVDGDFPEFGGKAEIVNVSVENDYTTTYILDCYTIDRGCYNKFFTTKKCWDTYNIEIIGKDIMLNDVLNYLTIFEDDAEEYFDEVLCEWDLTSPYLKDQSEALVKYLNEL